MAVMDLLLLALIAGSGAGLLAGLIGIGGGIVIVPAIYFGLIHSGFLPRQRMLRSAHPSQRFHQQRSPPRSPTGGLGTLI